MIIHIGFKKYLDFIFLPPPKEMFTHDLFYASVGSLLEQTTIYTQITYTEHRTDQLSLVKTCYLQNGSLIYSSHRSIFSRESMPPPSDSATHWPISEHSALIPSTSQELFLLALFGSRSWVREHPASSEERPPPSLLRTFHMEDLHWRSCCY